MISSEAAVNVPAESSLAFIDGLWWPASDGHAHVVLPAEVAPAVAAALPHLSASRVCVQAGGNVGVWPLYLANHFDHVYTFEPETVNFECLMRNIAGKGNITAARAAVGSARGSVGMRLHPQNTGGHNVAGEGDIPMTTIDALELPVCDLLWLDIEGYEIFALRGAEETIRRSRPLVVIEDGGLSNNYGIPTGAEGEWLAERGYRRVGDAGRDSIYVPMLD